MNRRTLLLAIALLVSACWTGTGPDPVQCSTAVFPSDPPIDEVLVETCVGVDLRDRLP